MNWREYQKENLKKKSFWDGTGYVLFLLAVPFILYFLLITFLSMGA